MPHVKIIKQLTRPSCHISWGLQGMQNVATEIQLPLNASKKHGLVVIGRNVYVAEIRPLREDDIPPTFTRDTSNNNAQARQRAAWEAYKNKHSTNNSAINFGNGFNLPAVIVFDRVPASLVHTDSFLSYMRNWITDKFSVGIMLDGADPSSNPILTSVKELPRHILHISVAAWDLLSGLFASKPNPYHPSKVENPFIKKQDDRLFDTRIDRIGEGIPQSDNASFTAPNTPVIILNSKTIQKLRDERATPQHDSSKTHTTVNIWGSTMFPTQPKDKTFKQANLFDTVIFNEDGTLIVKPYKQ